MSRAPNDPRHNLTPPKLFSIPARVLPHSRNTAPLSPLNSEMVTGPLKNILLSPEMREIDISRY